MTRRTADHKFHDLDLWLDPIHDYDCTVSTDGARHGGWYQDRAGVPLAKLALMLSDPDYLLTVDEAESFGACIKRLRATEDRHNPPPEPLRTQGIAPAPRGVLQGTLDGRFHVKLSEDQDSPERTIVELETGSNGWLRRVIAEPFKGRKIDTQLVREAIADMMLERGRK